ncbi:hypothetical protein V6N13_009668 [Hibiscus sabdariffa]|uniref:Uncharacterized protein n=2 Tax=Hibiscus sabdariffa TaxID=183260 RepID=A0ABR2B4T2_9ROSI
MSDNVLGHFQIKVVDVGEHCATVHRNPKRNVQIPCLERMESLELGNLVGSTYSTDGRNSRAYQGACQGLSEEIQDSAS